MTYKVAKYEFKKWEDDLSSAKQEEEEEEEERERERERGRGGGEKDR